MIIGTLFTLFVVPSIYVLVAKSRVPGRAPVEETEDEKLPELAGAI